MSETQIPSRTPFSAWFWGKFVFLTQDFQPDHTNNQWNTQIQTGIWGSQFCIPTIFSLTWWEFFRTIFSVNFRISWVKTTSSVVYIIKLWIWVPIYPWQVNLVNPSPQTWLNNGWGHVICHIVTETDELLRSHCRQSALSSGGTSFFKGAKTGFQQRHKIMSFFSLLSGRRLAEYDWKMMIYSKRYTIDTWDT